MGGKWPSQDFLRDRQVRRDLMDEITDAIADDNMFDEPVNGADSERRDVTGKDLAAKLAEEPAETAIIQKERENNQSGIS